ISEIVLKEEVKNIYEKKIQLKVNGELRQDEYLNNMVFKIPYLISFLSHHLPLKRGDIIFTGTPKGVGKVNSGDKIICSVNDLVELRSHVL
ncbi:MAG: fumarylacetoacetate hydrolase family protein, partial [Spirochaetota bacterium]|nr:fumarylacetoacetate hydrolase family protein [Spirochaetota bacterium]